MTASTPYQTPYERIGGEEGVRRLVKVFYDLVETEPEGAPLYIGKYVTVGHACILHGCEIGDECLIGMGAIVMDHVVMQPRVLLGAGSLVPEGKVLESGWLYIGRPAKAVRPLTDAEIAGLRSHAGHYVELAADYLK